MYTHERDSGRKRGGGVDKILRVLAQISSLTFCPVCWPTDRNQRMERGRKTDSSSGAPGLSWPNQ